MISFQQGEEQHKKVLLEMWELCFPDDTHEFRSFYFDKVYKNNETLVALENNHPVASLQMIPYQFKLDNSIFESVYISGAMTHPSFQGKGYMGKLLNYAFELMEKRNIPISFLIPQNERLFDYYTKFGYYKAFPWNFNTEFTLKTSNNNMKIQSQFAHYRFFDDLDLDFLYASYSRFLKQKNRAILKTKEQFSNILEDLFIDRGIVFVGKNEIALTIPGEENSLIIKECLSLSNSNELFLQYIAEITGKDKIIEINSQSQPISHFWGMIRVADKSIVIPKDIYMNTMLN